MKVLDKHIISSVAYEVMPLYDITEAYLFGSYARKEADEDSDVDICIECGDRSRFSLLGALELPWRRHLADPSTLYAAATPSIRAPSSATSKTGNSSMRNPDALSPIVGKGAMAYR